MVQYESTAAITIPPLKTSSKTTINAPFALLLLFFVSAIGERRRKIKYGRWACLLCDTDTQARDLTPLLSSPSLVSTGDLPHHTSQQIPLLYYG